MRAMDSGLDLMAVDRKGREFPVDISLSSLHDEGGGLLICSAIRDLTEVAGLKQSLESLGDRFHVIAQHSFAWETWVDSNGRAAWIAPGVERITGYSPQECGTMEEFPLPIVAEEYREEVRGFLQEAGQGGSSDGRQFPIHHRDGHRVWIALSWRPVTNRKHDPLGHLLYFEDRTERKHLEDALKHNRHQLQSILDQVQASIHVKDREGRYLFLNRACEQRIQCSRDALIGKHAEEVEASEIPMIQEAGDSEVRETGRSIEKEEELTIDGHRRLFITRIFPLNDEWGRLFATAAISTEHSRERQLQSELDTAQHEIERLKGALQEARTVKPALPPSPVPQQRPEQKTAAVPAKPEDPHPSAGWLKGKAILLVDDDSASRSALAGLLQPFGPELDEASNGREAVEMVRCREYDAVLMDLEMPELDGLQASRRIRSERQGKPLTIIAVTSNTSREDRERCLKAGMDAHLAKPVDREMLFSTLKHHLDPEGSPRPFPPPNPDSAAAEPPSQPQPPSKPADFAEAEPKTRKKARPSRTDPPRQSTNRPPSNLPLQAPRANPPSRQLRMPRWRSRKSMESTSMTPSYVWNRRAPVSARCSVNLPSPAGKLWRI